MPTLANRHFLAQHPASGRHDAPPDPAQMAYLALALAEKHRLVDRHPLAVPVPGISRDIQVKIACERAEWEQAFRLVAANYRARGYESTEYASAIRFTQYHALPDSVTLLACHKSQVLATLSIIPDNILLGLPMESIYEAEIQDLRQSGRRLAEATSLADTGLSLREFVQVFLTLIKLAMQYHAAQGGDTWVITVNPRHRNFYTRMVGFVPLGPCRAYPLVHDAPAEAYLLDLKLMKANAPKMYQQVFGERLPRQALVAPALPRHLVQYFGSWSTPTCRQFIREIFSYVDSFGSPRRW